jgi:hypothetical protein
MRIFLKALMFLCVICAFTEPVSATLVDWSALNWPAGSLSNSYDVDPSSSGNDVTITVSGDTGQLQPATGSGQQTPAITSNLEGGFGAGHMSLQLALDLTSHLQGVTITIDLCDLNYRNTNRAHDHCSWPKRQPGRHRPKSSAHWHGLHVRHRSDLS